MSTRGNVLIADDEEDFRLSTSALLEERDLSCRCVSNAESALEIASEGWPDVILSDINMPGNSKLELLGALRGAGSDAAIILITGYPSFGSAAESLNLGVTGYLVKPFEINELMELVERSLWEVAGIRQARRIGERLEALNRDVSFVSDMGQVASRRAPPNMVLNLAFDGIIGILLDLKQEIAKSSAPGFNFGSGKSAQISRLAGAAFDATPELKSLSSREREVLMKLVSGDRVSAIARELFISEHTVRNHLKSIFRKVGVRSQSELLERLNQIASS